MNKFISKNWLFMNKAQVRFFQISHICGWIIATMQTLWIVSEIRKVGKSIKRRKDEEQWHKQL